jgi:hypothetical protein
MVGIGQRNWLLSKACAHMYLDAKKKFGKKQVQEATKPRCESTILFCKKHCQECLVFTLYRYINIVHGALSNRLKSDLLLTS